MAQPVPKQTRLPHNGPGSKAVRLVVLSTVLTATAVGAVALHNSYAQLRSSMIATLPTALKWSRERVRSRVEAFPKELGWIAQTEGVRAWAESPRARGPHPAKHDTQLDSALADALERFPTIAGVIVLDRQGNTRASAGRSPEIEALRRFLSEKSALDTELVDVMQSSELRNQLAATDSSETRVFSTKTATPSPLASAPLRDEDGRTVASIHGLLHRQELSRLLRADLLDGGNLYLADPSGRVVATAGGGGESEEILSPSLLEVRSEPEAVFLWDDHPSMVVSAAMPAGVFDWTLVVRQTPVSATGRLFLALAKITAVGMGAVVLFTFVASLSARKMTHRFQTLFDAMQGLSKGDLTIEISDRDVRGQFAALFRTFNAAAKRQREKTDNADANLRSLVEQNLAFQKQNDLLSTLSVTDGLTGLHNHRYFKEQLHREVKRQQRTREDLSLLIIDIDDFKQLNDRYGHAAGDEFLKQLARILEELVRDTDVLARYGGEEFVILATGTDALGALILAEKLRTQVAETSFIVDSSMRPRRVTVSIGVSLYKHSSSEMFTAADAALYRAKASGKNCVVCDEEPPNDV